MPRPVRLGAAAVIDDNSAASGANNNSGRGDGAGADRPSRRRSQMYAPPGEASQPYTYHRRDKTKSSQSHTYQDRPGQYAKAATGATVAQRPDLKGRANSAPQIPKGQTFARLDEHDREDDDPALLEASGGDDEEIAGDPFFQQYVAGRQQGSGFETPDNSEPEDDVDSDTEGAFSPSSSTTRFRPDSVAEPLGSPLSPPPVTFAGRMHEINIAVLGASGVGKSSFIQRVFDHRAPPTLTVTPRKMSIDGEEYTVRLIELLFDDLVFDIDNRITWPEMADNRPFPPIDGVLTLYDVMNKESLADVPETLRAVYKSSIPFHLVACKCDNHANLRSIDPASVSQRAKALIGAVSTFETSETQPGTQKRCLFALLRVIVTNRSEHPAILKARRRANSNVTRTDLIKKHARTNSELSDTVIRNQYVQAYETAGTGLETRSRSANNLLNATPTTPSQSHANLSNVASYDTLRSGNTSHTSHSESDSASAAIIADRPSIEKGYTWDQLVDRLLAQPLSKNDVKYVAIFLALYRAFATPGQLLEAILRRFNEISLNEMIPEMSRTVIQLRHLAILEQWVSTYPGDFTHSATRASLCRFVALISNTRIFSVAAREIAADLEVGAEDDDADWACCDRSRSRPDTMLTFMSSTSTLHEENFEDLVRELSGMSFTGTLPQPAPFSPNSIMRSPGTNSGGPASSSGQTMLAIVETAAIQARSLTPNPRLPMTKPLWQVLMDTPDEAVAKELTRMDWTMFLSIRPRDLVRHVSLNASQKKASKSLENVHRMIEHFNHLAWWVANFVLLREKSKHRALMLEKFMRVARKLRELNNYNSLGAIIAGINSTSVHRLNATRDLISSFVVRDFMKLEILMGTQKSHFAYRLAWENSSGERIPYIPLHRRDLVTALEGNRTWMEGPEKIEIPRDGADASRGTQMVRRYVTDGKERINWKKFEIMGEVVVGVQSAQAVPAGRMAKNETVRESVLDVRILKDDDELYGRSAQLEPSGMSNDNKKKFSNWFQRGASSA